MDREGGDKSAPIDFFGRHPQIVIRTAFPPKARPILGLGNPFATRLFRRFTSDWAGSFLRTMRPVKMIDEAVKRYPSENTVGVHIRRIDESKPEVDFPDFAARFHATTLDSFKRRMHLELKKSPSTQFFLATNLAEIEQLFAAEFGSAVHVHKKESYSRQDPRGIQDALIDLKVLSKTKLIIGTRSSSFGGLAAKIGGIKIVYPASNQANPK
jgi:hypothetical protein